MSHKEGIFDREKIHFNLVRVHHGGKVFEIVVDPDLAIAYKAKSEKTDDDLRELLRAEKIFHDAKKGLIASDEDVAMIFGTSDVLAVSRKMIDEGEIQLTSEYREKLREEKRIKILNLIHRLTVEPKSMMPHPISRIENAMNEAKVRIDEFKRAEDQVQEIISKLKVVLPLKSDERLFSIKLPLQYAAKLHSSLRNYGKLESENWLSDGSYLCKLRLPAGLQGEVIDDLNKKTHGAVSIELVKE